MMTAILAKEEPGGCTEVSPWDKGRGYGCQTEVHRAKESKVGRGDFNKE